MISAVVLDDEAIIAADVAHQINARTGWSAEATTSVDGAIDILQQGNTQVLFLDIEMPGTNGVELANTIKRDFPAVDIIFVTAYPEYAAKAFRVSAVDYVLKPVARHVLAEACGRIERKAAVAVEDMSEHKFVVRSFGRVDIVPFSEIILVRAERNYVALVCPEREYLYRATVGEIEKELLPHGFLRCHRSYLVRPSQIKTLVRSNGVLAKLMLVSGHEVAVGAVYRTALKSACG